MTTLNDIKNSFRPLDNGHILLRPCDGQFSFCELPITLLNKAIDEIATKVNLVECGIDEFTACEKFTLLLLKAHAEK